MLALVGLVLVYAADERAPEHPRGAILEHLRRRAGEPSPVHAAAAAPGRTGCHR